MVAHLKICWQLDSPFKKSEPPSCNRNIIILVVGNILLNVQSVKTMLSFMCNILLPPPLKPWTPCEHIFGIPYQVSCFQLFSAVGLICSCSWEYFEEQSSSTLEVDVEPRSTQFQRIRGFSHDSWRNIRSSSSSNSFKICYWDSKDQQDYAWKIDDHIVIDLYTFSFLPFLLHARIRS